MGKKKAAKKKPKKKPDRGPRKTGGTASELVAKGRKALENRPPKKVGRPPGRKVVTPEVLDVISEMLFTGFTESEISRKLGVSRASIQHHVSRTLRGRWDEFAKRRIGQHLGQIDAMKRIGWRKFRESQEPQTEKRLRDGLNEAGSMVLVEKIVATKYRDGETRWLDVVQWCLEHEAKILGYYSEDRQREEMLRFAGMDREKIEAEMIKRLFAHANVIDVEPVVSDEH